MSGVFLQKTSVRFVRSLKCHYRMWCGLLCFVTYVIGGTNLVPGLLLAAASLDEQHEHIISGKEDGTVELRLRHEIEPGSPRAACHHHSFAGKLLCFFTRPSTDEPDHVIDLALAPSSGVLGDEDDDRGTAAQDEEMGLALSTNVECPALSAQQLGLAACALDGAAQRSSFHLQVLRSSVLLV